VERSTCGQVFRLHQLGKAVSASTTKHLAKLARNAWRHELVDGLHRRRFCGGKSKLVKPVVTALADDERHRPAISVFSTIYSEYGQQHLMFTNTANHDVREPGVFQDPRPSPKLSSARYSTRRLSSCGAADTSNLQAIVENVCP
jgi:hypothetical protein